MTDIELPRDAVGREIPLDTEALYDKSGERLAIYAWKYMPQLKHSKWRMRFLFDDSNCEYYPDEYYLAPPDSWEQLEEDLTAFDDEQIYGPCHYFHELGDDCMSCPARDDACADAVMRDVASRIRNLRGEDE